MNKYFFFFFTIFFLTSCQSVKDAGKVLRNEKVRTTDEFLIEKKDDLVLPPDYRELPKPNSLSEKNKLNDEEKIKKILKTPQDENMSSGESSSAEESILKKIRK